MLKFIWMLSKSFWKNRQPDFLNESLYQAGDFRKQKQITLPRNWSSFYKQICLWAVIVHIHYRFLYCIMYILHVHVTPSIIYWRFWSLRKIPPSIRAFLVSLIDLAKLNACCPNYLAIFWPCFSWSESFNSFFPNSPFLYPLKSSENR